MSCQVKQRKYKSNNNHEYLDIDITINFPFCTEAMGVEFYLRKSLMHGFGSIEFIIEAHFKVDCFGSLILAFSIPACQLCDSSVQNALKMIFSINCPKSKHVGNDEHVL